MSNFWLLIVYDAKYLTFEEFSISKNYTDHKVFFWKLQQDAPFPWTILKTFWEIKIIFLGLKWRTKSLISLNVLNIFDGQKKSLRSQSYHFMSAHQAFSFAWIDHPIFHNGYPLEISKVISKRASLDPNFSKSGKVDS